jgi:hypothetical protein
MQVTIQMDISDEFIGDVIDTAGYGIGYWVETAVWDEDGKTYTITEQETADEFVITYRRIAKSIEELIAGKSNVRDSIIDNLRKAVTEDDGSYVDADVADVVIQYAIFGEMVYG